MTKYALFDEDGFPTGFYSEDIHGENIPPDAVKITNTQWMSFLNNQGTRKWKDGKVVAFELPVPLPAEDDYRLAIQRLIDDRAQSRRYDSGNSLATYVVSSNPDWAAEAQAFVLWRDAVWAHAYVELDKVLAGEREQPTIEAFIGGLPELVWPEAE